MAASGRGVGPAAEIERVSGPLEGYADLDPVVDRVGDARFVLIGEASHGTSEYYEWRARLTERLIEEEGFSFVGVEGDWPDCYRVNRYVKGLSDSGDDAHDVLFAFDRWPTWMWANREVERFVERLREWNDARDVDEKAGFFGLDVYSLWDSLAEVTDYLRREAPEAVDAAQRAFACFEPYGEDAQQYARATMLVPESCEAEVVDLLREVRASAAPRDEDGRDGHFDAEQNALVARNAERYYRAMVSGGPESWNVRDRHMMETLERLADHHGPRSRGIVWEHNTHIGDARFTDMAESGMVNVGQLARERYGDDDAVLVGLGSYSGSVIAARAWEAPVQRMPVPPARDDSWERVLHDMGARDRVLVFDEESREGPLMELRGHRAIGVVYHPRQESWGNYVPTVLPRRYDAFLYVDESRALDPLHPVERVVGEPGETYPFGV